MSAKKNKYSDTQKPPTKNDVLRKGKTTNKPSNVNQFIKNKAFSKNYDFKDIINNPDRIDFIYDQCTHHLDDVLNERHKLDNKALILSGLIIGLIGLILVNFIAHFPDVVRILRPNKLCFSIFCFSLITFTLGVVISFFYLHRSLKYGSDFSISNASGKIVSEETYKQDISLIKHHKLIDYNKCIVHYIVENRKKEKYIDRSIEMLFIALSFAILEFVTLLLFL